MTNAAPVATVTNVPTGVLAGSNASVTFGATDPSAADTAAGFTYLIDWGDGTPAQSVTAGTSTAIGHTYATAGTFTIAVTATDKDGATSSATSAITVNPAVTADAGGPYTIAEGQTLTLDATGSVAGPTATYAWDLDGDGQFDDATGPTPQLSPDELAALGLADGPAGPLPITLRVTDGPTVGTATTTYAIRNLAPVATVQVFGPAVAGIATTVKVGAEDPSPTDAAAQFEYRIDWDGDGLVDEVVTGPADPPVTHTYPSAGTIALSVIAVDKDGAASTPTAVSVTVSPAAPAAGGGTGAEETTPETTAQETAGGLAATGADVAMAALTATTLVGAGVLLIILARRRNPRRRT